MQSGCDKFQCVVIYLLVILQVLTYSLGNYLFQIFFLGTDVDGSFPCLRITTMLAIFSCLLLPYLTPLILKGFILHYEIKQTEEHTLALRPSGTAQSISTWQTHQKRVFTVKLSFMQVVSHACPDSAWENSRRKRQKCGRELLAINTSGDPGTAC